MTTLEIVLAVAGVGVTMLVLAAMLLLVPGNTVEERPERSDTERAEPEPTAAWRAPRTSL
jgi:hypothetical protein